MFKNGPGLVSGQHKYVCRNKNWHWKPTLAKRGKHKTDRNDDNNSVNVQ